MSSSVPTYDTDADPRVYGFDLQNGELTAINAFDGQWGFGEVPSSDGSPEYEEKQSAQAAKSAVQGEVQLQVLQQQANAAAGVTQAAAAALSSTSAPAAVVRAASAEQAMFTPNARPVFAVKPTENLYRPPAVQPLYKMPGGTPIFQDTNVRPLYAFEQQAAQQAAQQSAVQPYANAMVQRTPVAAFGNPGTAGTPGDLSGLILRTPPPAVPAPHRVPPYPAQGHQFPPQMFDGPEGTSPMRRGDPNVSAYAAAPKVPRDLTGGTYPYMGSGTYIRQDQPRFAGYAGVDLADLDTVLGASEPAAPAAPSDLYKAPKKSQYRDVAGSGGYVYRQFMDGTIEIRVSGNVKALPTGTLIKKSDAKKWNAITGEIGTWESYREARRKAVGQGVALAAGLAANVAGAVGRKKRRKGKKRRKAAAAAAPVVVEAPAPEGEIPAEETSGLPSWAIPVGVGVAILLFVTMSGKKEGKQS